MMSLVCIRVLPAEDENGEIHRMCCYPDKLWTEALGLFRTRMVRLSCPQRSLNSVVTLGEIWFCYVERVWRGKGTGELVCFLYLSMIIVTVCPRVFGVKR